MCVGTTLDEMKIFTKNGQKRNKRNERRYSEHYEGNMNDFAKE